MEEAFQEKGIEQVAAQAVINRDVQTLIIPVNPGIETTPEHLGWGEWLDQVAEGLRTSREEVLGFIVENKETITKVAIGLGVFAGASVAVGIGLGVVEFIDAQPVRGIDFSQFRVISALSTGDWQGAIRNYLEWGDYLHQTIEYSAPFVSGGYVQTTLDTGGPLETIADVLGIARERVAAGCETFDVTMWNPGRLAQHLEVEAVDSLGRVVDAVGLSTDKLSSHTEVVFCAEDIAGAVTTKRTEPIRSTALRLP